MKRTIVAVLLIICLALNAGAEGILPSLYDTIGKPMPSLDEAIRRYPDEESADEDGASIEIFHNVTETEFNTFSVYLSEKGASLADYQTVGTGFSASIVVEGKMIAFTYDMQTLEATVTYPKGTYDEWLGLAKAQYASGVRLLEAGNALSAASVLFSIPNYSGYRPAAEYLEAHPEIAAAAAAAAREAKQKILSTVGGTVTFGHYPQTIDGDDETPIEWLVLAVDGNRILLLSKYGLDAMPYNEKWVDITWEKCSMRTWLNDTFLNEAFTEQEQMGILTTKVNNKKSQKYFKWNTNGGNDTEDKIFLLSYAEAKKYLGVTYDKGSSMKAQIVPTAYAKKHNASTYDRYKTADGTAAGLWWLRSPGVNQSSAAIVNYDGSLSSRNVGSGSASVRPALWIDLESNIITALTAAATTPAAETPTPTSTKTPTPTKKPSVTAGSYIKFGHYPQTAAGNDKTPIEWLVLDVQGNKALLLSRYGLDAKPYHKEWVDITWEKCSLRTWLNKDFLKKAFNVTEQVAILTTAVDNGKSQGFDYTKVSRYARKTDGGKNTQDKVFLLSYAEAHKYFGILHSSYYKNSYGNYNFTNRISRVSPTAWAIKNGAILSSEYYSADGQATEWLLRSPGQSQNMVACVGGDGSLYNYFGGKYGDGCVRPALWVNLEAYDFGP